MRLLVLLPLVLTRFDETEVACWFLFSSILFFGQIISAQTTGIFSRMIALSMGGAVDLSPLRAKSEIVSDGNPNWALIKTLYATQHSINALLAALGLGFAGLLGYYSMEPLLRDYGHSREIWIAFSIFLGGYFFQEFFRKFSVTLRGLNQVALTNRWASFVSLVSSLSGAGVLILGGGIIELAMLMQAVTLSGIVISWYLLTRIVEPKFRHFPSWGWDLQILGWVKEPLCKGVVQMVANRGGARVASVVLARHADPGLLASMLLAIRLIDVVDDFSTSPIVSNVPRMSRQLGAGKIEELREGILRYMKLSMWAHVILLICVGFAGVYFLPYMNSEIEFLPLELFLMLGLFQSLFSTVRRCLMISAIGNNIVAVLEFSIAAVVTVLASIFLIPMAPFWGFIVSVYIPVLIVVNVRTLFEGCEIIEANPSSFAFRTLLLPWLVLLIVYIISSELN